MSFAAPPLVPAEAIAAFLDRSCAEIQQELAEAGVLPVVNAESTGALIGYDPCAVQEWFAAQLAHHQHAPRARTPAGSVADVEPLGEVVPADDATLLDLELESLNPLALRSAEATRVSVDLDRDPRSACLPSRVSGVSGRSHHTSPCLAVHSLGLQLNNRE